MKPKAKANSLVTTVFSALLTIGFLWFFILSPPPAPNPATVQRQFHPLRREEGGSILRFDLRNITSTSHALENRERVLILTPIARWYEEYWTNLLALTYPRELIDLGFILPKGDEGDNVLEQLRVHLRDVQGKTSYRGKFNHVTILRQDVEVPIVSQNEQERHKLEHQKARRSTLSVARNSLLLTTLAPHISWVLWLDADIIETPQTILQDLTRHNKDIVVANAYQRYTDDQGNPAIRPYDFNSWIDSEIARNLAESMDENDVLFEGTATTPFTGGRVLIAGYAEIPTYRTLMAYLYEPDRDAHEELSLDGVGTTALMVKAAVHRDGATFPAFPFYHLLESEGFARMARRLGYRCWGLPQYLVYHYNE